MKTTPAIETPLQRLQSAADWAHTSEMSRVSIRKEDLYWAVEQLAYLQMILGRDLDLEDDLGEPADLSNEEAPL